MKKYSKQKSRKYKSKKQRHVRFLGGNGHCGNPVSLFPNNEKIVGGRKRKNQTRKIKRIHKKRGGSFSNFVTNLVNPISYTTTSPIDQPAITNYYSNNASKI